MSRLDVYSLHQVMLKYMGSQVTVKTDKSNPSQCSDRTNLYHCYKPDKSNLQVRVVKTQRIYKQ